MQNVFWRPGFAWTYWRSFSTSPDLHAVAWVIRKEKEMGYERKEKWRKGKKVRKRAHSNRKT